MTRVACAVMLCMVCSLVPAYAGNSMQGKDFEAVLGKARGTEARFAMFGGWAHVNSWVDGYVAKEMRKRYDITVKRIPMDASVFVNKLLTEKATGKATGTMDLLWINGENFKNSMEAGLLWGPFAENLLNYQLLVDPASVKFDFGYPTQGYEAPYGRAQFVFEYDMARIPQPPKNVEELVQWIKANPGRFTYPQPPDFTGSAFIRQVFYALTGGHEQYMDGYDAELVAHNASKLWAWLNEVKPFLWREGRAYPRDSAALDTLFARGDVDMAMSYHPSHAQSKILDKTYPDTVRTFVLQDGAIYNTHFTAIPFNAPNKAGAMVLANFLLSPEAQLSKFDPAHWGDYPAIDLKRLPPDMQQAFTNMDLGEATLGPAALAAVAVPEIPSAYLEQLEQGWEDSVLRR